METKSRTGNPRKAPTNHTATHGTKGAKAGAHQSGTAPPFPEHVIQGLAKQFVNLYDVVTEAPPQFLWAAFVTYLGNALCRYILLAEAENSEPRLFCVALGASARTRKTTANKIARGFFETLPAPMMTPNRQRTVSGFGSSEGLLKVLKDEPNPTVLLVDEVNTIAKKCSANGTVGIALFHELFEDHRYEHQLAEKKHVLDDARLSILSASTEDDFRNTWDSQSDDAGFFSRLFLVWGESEKNISFKSPTDAKAKAALQAEVKALIDSRASEGLTLIPLTPEARKEWDCFYAARGNGKEWNRIDTYGARFMVLQAVIKGESRVSLETVREVIDLLKYEVAVRTRFNPVIASNKSAALEAKILTALREEGPMKRSALYRKTSASRDGQELFQRALEGQIKAGEIERIGGTGRAEVWKYVSE